MQSMMRFMGGLVARKYLYDMIKGNNRLQVKKLMLYAVPNNGSDWAKFSKLYKHEQIEQLDKSSDFIRYLNREVQHIKLEDKIDVRYVVGKYDEVVDESSAEGYWGNDNVKSLPNGHVDIVKPKDKNDLSFLVLKSFLTTENSLTEHNIENVEVKKTPFIQEVTEALNFNHLAVCYSQEHIAIAQEKEILEAKLKESFNTFYRVDVPSFENNEAKYFQGLATSSGLKYTIKSANDWKSMMKTILLETTNRVMFLFSDIADGDKKLDLKMAKKIRSLKNSHFNFYAVCIGGKDLAELVYSSNGDLSPLNTAIDVFFPMQSMQIEKSLVEKELLCECLLDEWKERWTIWHLEEGINILFWKNILLHKEGVYEWRDESTKKLAKEIFGCQ